MIIFKPVFSTCAMFVCLFSEMGISVQLSYDLPGLYQELVTGMPSRYQGTHRVLHWAHLVKHCCYISIHLCMWIHITQFPKPGDYTLLVNRAGTTSEVGQVSTCLPFRPSSVRLIFFQSDLVGFLCFAMQTAWPRLSWDFTTMCLNILYESMWCSQSLQDTSVLHTQY